MLRLKSRQNQSLSRHRRTILIRLHIEWPRWTGPSTNATCQPERPKAAPEAVRGDPANLKAGLGLCMLRHTRDLAIRPPATAQLFDQIAIRFQPRARRSRRQTAENVDPFVVHRRRSPPTNPPSIFLDGELSHTGDCRAPESLRPGGLRQPAQPMGGRVSHQQVEPPPSYQHIVCREHQVNLVVAAFGIQKLVPRQHVGAVEKRYLQGRDTRTADYTPRSRFTGRCHVHVLAPPWTPPRPRRRGPAPRGAGPAQRVPSPPTYRAGHPVPPCPWPSVPIR